MSDNCIHLVPGVLVENFGDNVVVALPGQSEVLSLTGEMAEIVVALRDQHDLPRSNPDALTELERWGVITLSDYSGLSRRQILTAGAAGLTGGVLALSLPIAAAASSFVCPVVTGELTGFTKSSLNSVQTWRVNLSPDFSPFGTYWLEVFKSPDRTTRAESLGFRPVEIGFFNPNDPSFGIVGQVARDQFEPEGSSGFAIGVLYSDEGKLCEVGEDDFDLDD